MQTEQETIEIAHNAEALAPELLGSNQTGMRGRNERLVLTILRRQGALPKAEIARKTGLSAQTVSVIMRALENDGLLLRGERVRGRVGQPSVPMRLNPDGAFFFGLKVGRRSAELVLVNFIGEILARRKLTYPYPTPAGTVEFVRAAVFELTQDLTEPCRARVSGLGIASPYYLWEWASVIGVAKVEMDVWREFDLKAEIGKLFEFPVFLGNDMSCACAAELVFGQSAKPPDFLYFYIGYFIGGGVVLNGSLYTGSSGNAGAIGPLPGTDASNPSRQLVDVASLVGLERRLIEAGGDAKEIWENPENWSIDGALIDDWLAEVIPAMTKSVIAYLSLIDFSTIVIDGSMPKTIRDRVVAGVATEFLGSDLSGLNRPAIIAGTIGTDARPLGGASLPLLNRFVLDH